MMIFPTAPCSSTKAGLRGGGFQINPSLVFVLHPVCDIFGMRADHFLWCVTKTDNASLYYFGYFWELPDTGYPILGTGIFT